MTETTRLASCRSDKGDKIKNLMPTTLLNTEFKILSKLLAKRLARIVQGLVWEAQSCDISGRFIHDNLHLIRYSIERVGQTSDKGGVLVHLDQSKTFDRLNHEYLVVVLEVTCLGPNFRNWITAMYSGIESTVRMNSFFSKLFEIERLVRFVSITVRVGS